MGKLAFNPVPVVAEFVEKGGCHSAKTVRAHFILFKTHAAYGPAESGFSKGNGFGAVAGKDILIAAGIRPQFFQNGQRLPAEGNKMVTPHFHAFRRDAPDVVLKIELLPFGATDFRCPAKGKGHNLQGAPDDQRPLIVVDGVHQPSHLLRRRQGGTMLFDMGHESAAQIRRRVTLRATGGNGIAHDAGTVIFERVRRAYDASRLDFPQQGQKFRGGYGIDRFGANEREKVSFHPPVGRFRIARRPFAFLKLKPFHCYKLKSILSKLLVLFSLSGRVYAVLQRLSGLHRLFPCFFQGSRGIGAEGNQLFLSHKVVFQPPALCAARRDEQVQSFAVKEFLRFFSRFCGADGGIGQGHGVILLQGVYYPDIYPKKWGMSMYLLKFGWTIT